MTRHEEPIGRVVEYDPDLGAARVHLEEGGLRSGDLVHITGPGTDVEDRVETLQLPSGPAREAEPGSDVGFKVPAAVEEGARVMRVVRSKGDAGDDPYELAEAGLLGDVFDT